MTFLHPTLFTDEFARCVRMEPATIRKKIRQREIKAHGKPYQIPAGELEKFGVSPAQALEVLRAPVGPQPQPS